MDKSNIKKYINYLSNTRINKTKLIVEVLSQLSYYDLQTFKKLSPKMFYGLLKVPYLKRKKYADIFNEGKVLWKDTIDVYGALSFVILNNADNINHYVVLKQQLDYNTAIMNYEKAYGLLEQIDKEVSVSMTGTYYLLKLTRLDKGITASTQLHNQICKENSLLSYFSSMALKSASIDIPFEVEIDSYYRALRGDEDINDFLTAFSFPYKDLKGDGWLKLLLCTSIIDLYEGFVLFLSKQSPQKIKDDSIRNLINDLANSIKDERILRLQSLINKDAAKRNAYKYEAERIILESFYAGNYDDVITKGEEYLKSNPLQSVIMDVVNKSCVKNDVMLQDLYPEGSLAGRIMDLGVFAYSKENFSGIIRAQLRNICMAWYTMPELRHFYQLLNDIDRVRRGSVYQNYWRYSSVPEIRDAVFFESKEDAVDYLENNGYNRDEGTQIPILEGTEQDTYNQSTNLLYGYSFEDLESTGKEMDEGDVASVLMGCITSQLFEKAMESHRFAEAVSLYVNVKLKHTHANIHINKKAVFHAMTDEEDGKLSNQLELAVFYTMINADVYKRYLAYKRYLKQAGLHKASEIEVLTEPIKQYFVGKVAERSVLTLHVREFDTDDDVDSERIVLCKKMSSVSDDKSYAEEITTLIKEHEIRTLAQQVNDSKIHVDVQPLINSEFADESLMFDTYQELDDNLELFEQKNAKGLEEFLNKQYEGKPYFVAYELPTVKYKNVLFHQMFLGIRDKFLLDPRFGLDKYLSARIRHGTLLTQLRNHFLEHSLVTNKVEGGEYQRLNPWSQRRNVYLPETVKESINNRLLQFTQWIDEQLRVVKDEKIQIKTERTEGGKSGLFDYSEELMSNWIDALETVSYESFDAFVHKVISFLWHWTDAVLNYVRDFFHNYQEMVLDEMTTLQNDMMHIMSGYPYLWNGFKDEITTCKTEFQSDIAVVSSWFKPEQSSVRYFTIRQAVDTSLSVINKINQEALSFSEIIIDDLDNYKGEYFNAFHDIFHDMMNNILGYETKRPDFRGKGKISVHRNGDLLHIDVSNPIDNCDLEDIQNILEEQQNFPMLIAGGKTRKEKNSGCVKIYSTVMYTLGMDNKYGNKVENGCFVASLEINTEKLIYDENIVG